MVQLSQSGRVVKLVAVVAGNVYTANPGATAWTLATNNASGTPPLNATGTMQSSACIQKLWFADSINYVFYDPSTDSVEDWEASAGTLPLDVDSNAPRLICTWRGRIVLSGLIKDPQNWFMSAVGDPTNYDYAPLSPSPTDAIAGNNAPAGLIGDVVTGMIPYTDDCLIFLGDSSIYMMRGDPYQGGSIDRISDAIGGAWGQAWCKDPAGNVYFFSNRTGIYVMAGDERAGTVGQPQRISQPIENIVQQIDTGLNCIRMLWNDQSQGVHIFITPLDEPTTTTHLFYGLRNNGWWQDTFKNNDMNPVACTTFDGNDPGDRAPLIGSWDGYVRALSQTAETDDGEAIDSEVWVGPFLTKDFDDLMLKELQALLGESSNAVTFALHMGTTAEAARSSTAVLTGTWAGGRNLSNYVRRADHAWYIKITSSERWMMESIRMKLAKEGKVRMRGR